MINKCIIVPIAMLLTFFIPSLILPILLLGGLYLCFEGAEKVFGHHHVSKHVQTNNFILVEQIIAYEKDKIKGAIRTDFVLSIEIIVITLGTIERASLLTKFGVLALIAIVATVGVYGIVALIVKLDDMGLYLLTKSKTGFVGKFSHKIGFALVNSAPYLMKFLTLVGTVAMFLVGGGILSHSFHFLDEYFYHFSQIFSSTIYSITWLTKLSEYLLPLIFNGILGLLAGAFILLLLRLIKRAKR